jgi:hypothetical protein
MYKDQSQKMTNKDDFTAGWRQALHHWGPAVRVTSATFKLTNVGEKPVALEVLAAAIGLSPDDTAKLVLQTFPKRVRLQDGLVHFALPATRQPSSRFELRIGKRRMYTKGCAPDQFWIALFINEAVEIRSLSQITGTPIRVIVSADRVETVDPADAVVGLINPLAIQSVDYIEEFDQKVCVYQTFFASKEAGADWQRHHPQGKLFSVHEFFAFWQELLTSVVGDLMVSGHRKGSE